jgi:CheY-like chemotaxis protein
VSSVKSAIDLLAGGAVFDVVLCDLVMPESSGIELLAWLAEHRPRLRRRSILMSGMQAAQADMHPDVPVVQKPFDLRALRTLVCEVAQRA